MALKAESVDTLSEQYRSLLDQAIEASKLSYSPYSNFQVGAALLLSDGKVVIGANVENASYGAAICGERSALMHANALGRRDVVACAVIGRPRHGKYDPNEVVVPPCGICRQVLFEFQSINGTPITMILSNAAAAKVAVLTVDDILPGAFGPADLGINVDEFKTVPKA